MLIDRNICIYQLKLNDPEKLRNPRHLTVNLPITLSVQTSPIGWRVIESWQDMEPNYSWWRPTAGLAMRKLRSRAQKYILSGKYVKV